MNRAEKSFGVGGPAGDNQLVLVIEEDRAQRTFIALALAACGYRTLEASNGWSGLRLAQRHHPAVVLVGALLPELCAEGVLAALDSTEATRHTPVVAIGEHAAVSGNGACAPDVVVPNPAALDQLVDEVARIIARRPRSAPAVGVGE